MKMNEEKKRQNNFYILRFVVIALNSLFRATKIVCVYNEPAIEKKKKNLKIKIVKIDAHGA